MTPIAEHIDTAVGHVIETRWMHHRFRSRLEARWAVFFDALGLRWEYEREGYVLVTGAYLPDFWINEWQSWIEIKPWIECDRYPQLCETARHLKAFTGSREAYVIFGPPDLVHGAMIYSSLGRMVATHLDQRGPVRTDETPGDGATRAYSLAMSERFERR